MPLLGYIIVALSTDSGVLRFHVLLRLEIAPFTSVPLWLLCPVFVLPAVGL